MPCLIYRQFNHLNLGKINVGDTSLQYARDREARKIALTIVLAYSTIKEWYYLVRMGGAVASWLVRSTPERAVRVRALAGDSVLCSWARHFTLTVPLSTQVYKWVPAICWGNLTKLRGSDLRWTSILSRGSRNTSSRLMLQKPG